MLIVRRRYRSKLADILAACAYPDGQVWPLRHQQWPALARAARLGFIDSNQYLTDKGRELIAARKG